MYNSLLKSELEDNKIGNLTKELSIYHWDFHQEEVLGVNDDNKYLAYYKLEFNSFTSKFSGACMLGFLPQHLCYARSNIL